MAQARTPDDSHHDDSHQGDGDPDAENPDRSDAADPSSGDERSERSAANDGSDPADRTAFATRAGPAALGRPALDGGFWSAAQVVMPEERDTVQVTAKFDRDVVDWFRNQGRGYQARMNAVLRSYYEVHKTD